MDQETGFVSLYRIFEFNRMRNLVTSAQLQVRLQQLQYEASFYPTQESSKDQSLETEESSEAGPTEPEEPTVSTAPPPSLAPSEEFDAAWCVSFVLQALATNEYLETNESSVRLRHGWQSWVLQKSAVVAPLKSQDQESVALSSALPTTTNTNNFTGLPNNTSNAATVSQKSGITMAFESAAAALKEQETKQGQATTLSNEQQNHPLALSNKIQAPVLVGRGEEAATGPKVAEKSERGSGGDELFQFDEGEAWVDGVKSKGEGGGVAGECGVGSSKAAGLESEIEDEDVDSILIVARRNYQSAIAHQQPVQSSSVSSLSNSLHHLGLPPRNGNSNHQRSTVKSGLSTNSSSMSDMINEGLFLYEKGAFKAAGKNSGSSLLTEARKREQDQQEKEFNNLSVSPQQPPAIIEKRSDPVNVRGTRRFISGGLTAESPPVGWLVNQQHHSYSQHHQYYNNHTPSFSKSFEVPPAPPSSKIASSSFGERMAAAAASAGQLPHSFNQRSFGSTGRSYGNGGAAAGSFGGRSGSGSFNSSSFKEFAPFQHPSYELLKENGFVQHKYTKYHAKAIKGMFL